MFIIIMEKIVLKTSGYTTSVSTGTLDRVLDGALNEAHNIIRSNDPNWPLWQERYLEVRKQATEGN